MPNYAALALASLCNPCYNKHRTLRRHNIANDEPLTVAEVAATLRVSVATVKNELSSGRLHGFKVGRQWRIWQADLNEYTGKTSKELTTHER